MNIAIDSTENSIIVGDMVMDAHKRDTRIGRVLGSPETGIVEVSWSRPGETSAPWRSRCIPANLIRI